MKIRASLFALAMVASSVPAFFLWPAAASGKCQPGRSNNGATYFAGWTRNNAGAPGGVYSNILNYSPWVQPNSVVVGWSMLNRGTTQWAQVGWLEYAGGTRKTFVQWTTSPGVTQTKYFNPQPTGQSTYYTVLYNNTPGKFTFQVNNSTITTETATFSPDSAQISGETKTLASQMPGGVYSGEVFGDSHIYLGSWSNFSGSNFVTNTTYHGIGGSGGLQRNTWDWACPF